MNDASGDAWLRIAMTPGLGPKGYAALLRVLYEHGMDLANFFALSPAAQRALWEEAGQRASTLRRVLPDLSAIPSSADIRSVKNALLSADCHWVGAESPIYPRRLKGDLTSPPPVMFWQGNLSLLDSHPTVGIVGTVSPSRGGQKSARALGHILGESGWVVVSGLARGCDQAGHLGALEAGGSTAAFLPQGILTLPLPPEMRVFEHQPNFLLLSPWPPLAGWGGSYAVRRDTLIAEVSDGLIAVEMTAHSGGTRHTVNAARDRQRPVWTLAHEGPVPVSARGNAMLIRTGAHALRLGPKNELRDEDLRALMTKLKQELSRGKRRRAMQLEMF